MHGQAMRCEWANRERMEVLCPNRVCAFWMALLIVNCSVVLLPSVSYGLCTHNLSSVSFYCGIAKWRQAHPPWSAQTARAKSLAISRHSLCDRPLYLITRLVLNDSGGPPFHSPIYPPDDTMNRETVQFINSLSATVASQGSPPHTHSHDPLGPVHSHDHGGEHGHTHEHLDNPGSSLNPLVRDRQ